MDRNPRAMRTCTHPGCTNWTNLDATGRCDFHSAPPQLMDNDWKWWSGSNDEIYSHGPCDTREEAIEEAKAQGSVHASYDEQGHEMFEVFVVEALQAPPKLSNWVDVEHMLENAEERIQDSDRVHPDVDDGTVFDIPDEEMRLLEQDIKDTIDAWQRRRGIAFKLNTFSSMRNMGRVRVEYPDALDDPTTLET